MDISRALAAQLAVLTQSLDENIDLATELGALTDYLKTAVSSYAGMTMTLLAGDKEISFSVAENVAPTHVITASLRIPLDGEPGPRAGGHLTLYATAPGAFVDLAADVSYILGLDPAVLVLDAQLVPPSAESGVSGLADHSLINQAVGVLIDRGHLPESARAALRRLADLDGVDLAIAAERLLRAAVAHTPDGPVRPATDGSE